MRLWRFVFFFVVEHFSDLVTQRLVSKAIPVIMQSTSWHLDRYVVSSSPFASGRFSIFNSLNNYGPFPADCLSLIKYMKGPRI